MCISGRNFGSSRPIISRLELTILFRVMFVLTGNSRPTLATVRALCSHVFATNRPYFWVNYNNMLRSDKSQRGRRAPPKRAICFIVLSSFYPAQLCICVLFFSSPYFLLVSLNSVTKAYLILKQTRAYERRKGNSSHPDFFTFFHQHLMKVN